MQNRTRHRAHIAGRADRERAFWRRPTVLNHERLHPRPHGGLQKKASAVDRQAVKGYGNTTENLPKPG